MWPRDHREYDHGLPQHCTPPRQDRSHRISSQSGGSPDHHRRRPSLRKNLGPKGGTLKAYIEQCLESIGSLLVISVDEAVFKLSSHFGSALKLVIQVVLLQKTTSAQKTDAVRGGVVGQTNLKAVALELTCVGCSVADIAADLGRDNLADNVFVAEAHNEAVLRRSELDLVRGDETLAHIVVRLSLTTALVVRLILHELYETHGVCVDAPM